MIDLLIDFLTSAIAVFFFAIAINVYTGSVQCVESQLCAAREVVVDDAVYAQRVGAEKYSESKSGVVIASEILSKPDYRITVVDGVNKVSYRWFSDGSLLVEYENLNSAPGVENSYSELYHSGAELNWLTLIGEYSMKVEYDADSTQIIDVVYMK